MKIVSWNCNGAFRKKYKSILKQDADVYVIQECEPIESFKEPLKEIISNGFWEKGVNKKGVLVFAKNTIKLEKLQWDSYGMRVFIPIMINDRFPLVAVWTTKPAYIEEFYIWLLVNSDRINDECVIIGDFNSNAVWNKMHGERGHFAVVQMLKDKGLESAYHYYIQKEKQREEKQGEETQPTFYMHRNEEKPFHIDYCFIKKERIKEYNVLNNTMHNNKRWLDYSDHLPIMMILDEE